MKEENSSAAQTADSRGEISASVCVNPIIALASCVGAFITAYTVKRFVDKATVNKKD